MRRFIALAVLLDLSLTAFAEDIRLHPLKDRNGYFPFTGGAAQREAAAGPWLLK